MLKINILAGVLLVALSGTARADYKVKQYRQIMASNDETTIALFKSYLVGVGKGLAWANTGFRLNGSSQLFCVPAKMALLPENILDILARQIKEASTTMTEAELSEEWVEPLMLVGLENAFPCPTKK
ncbi:MAG: hypothetical protein LAO55_02695 [Acidobacteriia bacterium]|nr:hypothetical protein [Terriglobia bacterium]